MMVQDVVVVVRLVVLFSQAVDSAHRTSIACMHSKYPRANAPRSQKH